MSKCAFCGARAVCVIRQHDCCDSERCKYLAWTQEEPEETDKVSERITYRQAQKERMK